MSIDLETGDALRVPFAGDYLSVSGVDGTLAVAWTDTRDVRVGPDPREQGRGLEDHDGFDVFAHCAWVVMVPVSPNSEFALNNVCSVSPAGRQKFTCKCHGARLSGIRWFNKSSVVFAGALYITPTN